MNIGIVGGSLAGCSAATQLMKGGHQVSVFERSGKTLWGRGGGIATTTGVLNEIRGEGLIDDNFSSLLATRMPFVGKAESHEPYGRAAWSMPMELQVFHWNELWQQLRKNVPDDCYHSGVEIVGAKELESGKVALTTHSGEELQFDLVLFADGYNSFGRGILFPDKELKYRGYVLWRGLFPESGTKIVDLPEENMPRLSYSGEPGHNVVYFIPGSNGSVKEGERILNWAAYIAVPEEELDDLMTDKRGSVRVGTLPPGTLSERNEEKLKEYLSKHLPEFYANIVNNTTDSYIQVIYTLDLDSYYKGRICLIGDAGIVVQPFTGSGIFKGYNNIKDLLASLAGHDRVEEALKEWSDKQVATGKRLLSFGEQLERALIWEPMNFATANEQEVASWFKEAVTPPENFNFHRDD
ncbi:MAG: hypothetical protein AB7H80_18140 [Candidatus Kapaibacterium sp.]